MKQPAAGPLAAAFVLALTASAPAQDPDSGSSTDRTSVFDRSETHVLTNGLRVWIQPIPDAANVAVSLTLPYGHDSDPVGREQLAHFVEHMLLKGHMGRSEVEIEREVSERGGSSNGLTYDDHAAYYVHLPGEHAEFAIEWLWKVLSPHEMDPATVDAEREPIALEIGARRRELLDSARALFLNPVWLRQPGFWEREFGLQTYAARDHDRWKSLHAIQPAELSAHYDRYYVPSRMLLAISGDVNPAETLAQVERTFGTLPTKPEPEPVYSPRDSGQRFEAYRWQRRASVWHRSIYRLTDTSADDIVTAIFVGRFLNDRLTEILRRGDDKAVYGLSVGIDQHGPSAAFQIQASIRSDIYAASLTTIEAEVQALRTAAHDPHDFDALKASIAVQMRTSVSEPADLTDLHLNTLYTPGLFRDLPNLPREMASMTQERVASFVERQFVPEREVLEVTYPAPIARVSQWAISAGLLWLTYSIARLLMVKRIDMRGLVYVARLRASLPYTLIAGGLALSILAIVARIGIWAWDLAFARWIRPVDSFEIQSAVNASGLVLCASLVTLVLSRIPRKFLLLENELRVKSLMFRSRILKPDDIAAIELRGFRSVWLSRRLYRCVPITLGLIRRQVYLELRSGRSYFVRVRDRDELLELLRAFAPEARTNG
ncbi:MAG: putative Zn-dependent peptidase [Chlamydiales bacterium]|jgi:predicted Zn-dependent peptidase